MGRPFLIGSCTLGVMLAAAGYFAVLSAWRLYTVVVWRRRQRVRSEAAVEASNQ
jgi:uncharacterized protein (DUF2062 family)